MSPPKRDKFAALAAQQQQQNQEGTASSAPASAAPKRDKFAALAQRQQQPPESTAADAPPSNSNSSVTTPVAAKRDKFAALAQQQQTAPPSTAAPQTAVPPPKRDKFAALAQHQQQGVVTAAPAPKRDKLQALAQHQASNPNRPSPLKRDKFSALQQRPAVTASPVMDEAARAAQAAADALAQKCRQRDKVWKDLEKAEALTIQLLQIAQDTTDQLAEATTSNNVAAFPQTLQSLTAQYQDCVSQIHAKLQPHADLVQAYKPQTTRINKMYHGRVDLSLAQSKRTLLQELLDEQQQQQGGPDNGAAPDLGSESTGTVATGKRQREDDTS